MEWFTQRGSGTGGAADPNLILPSQIIPSEGAALNRHLQTPQGTGNERALPPVGITFHRATSPFGMMAPTGEQVLLDLTPFPGLQVCPTGLSCQRNIPVPRGCSQPWLCWELLGCGTWRRCSRQASGPKRVIKVQNPPQSTAEIPAGTAGMAGIS